MKTLTPTLQAAQKKPHRLPYVEAEIRDFEQGIKRLAWQRLYQGTEPDSHHGIAFDGQGNMNRIRAEGNDLYYQKQGLPFATPFPYTFPIELGEPPEFDTWTKIAADCAGPCAIAAYGANVYIFYRTTGNVIWKYYSHDYGQTWDDAQFVSYADILSLAACWWGTGNIVVCFALKSNELNGIVLDSSDQSTSQHIEQFHGAATHIFLNTYGIGATYNPFWPQCEIVLAAKESAAPYNHYDLWRTWFSDSYNFGALESFLMSPEGEDITYEYPDVHLPANAQDYETNRIVAVEKYAGIAPYNRPLTCHVVKGTYWNDTAFTEPKPFLDISSNYGLRLQSAAGYWWLSRPDGVWRAPRPADSPLDISKDIVSFTLRTHAVASAELASGPGTLVIELDNSRAEYTPIPSGLRFRSEIVLELGYKTTAGKETVDAGTYWIDSWEYSAEPNISRLVLYCLDGWSLANRWTPRYQMRWNQPGATPRSVWEVLYVILARIGIRLSTTPPQPRSDFLDNFYPEFTLLPGHRGDTAIRRLLAFVSDMLVFRGQEAFTKDPRDTETACYIYDVIASGAWQSHPILAGRYADAVSASWTRAIGRDEYNERIVADAFDWEKLQLFDYLSAFYDSNLDTAALAQERAEAILRQMSLRAKRGNLVIPTNVGQESLDVVEVTDARCGISQEKYRVQAIQTDYDRRKGIYTQRLTLCAP